MLGKTRLHIILLLFLAIPSVSFAQYYTRNSWEGIYGIGATNLMSDVGGPSATESNIIRANFWLTPQSFRPVFFGGLRYLQNNRHGYRVNLAVGSFSSADIFSDYWSRNFIVNTFFVELEGQYEFYLVKETGRRNVYRLSSYKWYKNLNIPTYLFIGLGTNIFFADVKLNERYLYPPFTEEYTFADESKHITAVIPFGIGIKYRLNKIIRFGVEAGYRFAFSDYLDDYSSVNSNWPDQYQFLLFSLNYKLKTSRSGLPRFSRFR